MAAMIEVNGIELDRSAGGFFLVVEGRLEPLPEGRLRLEVVDEAAGEYRYVLEPDE